MSYIDIPFPSCIAFGAMTGDEFITEIASNQAGFEQRTGRWVYSRQSYDIGFAVRKQSDYVEIKNHFKAMRGRLHSFPFKDPLDHEAKQSEGIMLAIAGTIDQFQMYKRYSGVNSYDRKITRPVAPVIYRNGVPATAGPGAGQYALDSSTGKVTFVADQTRTVSSHTIGTSHQFTLASMFSPPPSIGQIVFLSGVGGSAAALLNNLPLTISNLAGTTITVAVNTAGLSASGGNATRRVAAGELSWAGEFAVPCRYDVDKLPAVIVNRQGGSGELLVQCDQITVLEVKE